METVDKRAAVWKKKTWWRIMEKVDIVGRREKIVIAQQRGKSSHSEAT